ncbi:hypothetical protein ND748_01260 [Frankia sp. AiPs1]|uniref:hypothetical protein n=1 Tax=Frankia sp. AiPs1 TaxID=573493 RepID=UPI00204441C2|nr:hypothetical protein [Frankia sp. AiPs1]MCM3920318.1 hypothetical protein [Frankia sp. AiPs1]
MTGEGGHRPRWTFAVEDPLPLLVGGVGFRGLVYERAERGPGARVLDLGGDPKLSREVAEHAAGGAEVVVLAGDVPIWNGLVLDDGAVGLVVGNDALRGPLVPALTEIARVVRCGGWVSLIQPAHDRVFTPALAEDGPVPPRVLEGEVIWAARAVGLLPVMVGLGFQYREAPVGAVDGVRSPVTALPVTLATPVVQIDAVRVDPRPDRTVPPGSWPEWYEAYRRALDQALAVGIPPAAWQIAQAIGNHLARENDPLCHWPNRVAPMWTPFHTPGGPR